MTYYRKWNAKEDRVIRVLARVMLGVFIGASAYGIEIALLFWLGPRRFLYEQWSDSAEAAPCFLLQPQYLVIPFLCGLFAAIFPNKLSKPGKDSDFV
jgi:hypothetical protein